MSRVWGWVGRLLNRVGWQGRPDLVGHYVEQHPAPEKLVPGEFLVVRDGDLEKWGCLRCPGGCGDKIMLSMSPRRKPRWMVQFDWRGRPTVSPPVRQTNSCQCHFGFGQVKSTGATIVAMVAS
jgi:hypothetical protein